MTHCVTQALKVLLLLICCLTLLPASFADAQGSAGVGGDRPSAKTRRFPFKVILTGFLNTDPAPEELAAAVAAAVERAKRVAASVLSVPAGPRRSATKPESPVQGFEAG